MWKRDVVIALFFSLFFSFGCKDRKGGEIIDIPGLISVLYPIRESEKIIKDKLSLKVNLYDSDRVASFRVLFQGHVLFDKKFSELVEEKNLTVTVDLSSIDRGTKKLKLILIDSKGGEVQRELAIAVDRSPPSIKWRSPPLSEEIDEPVQAELQVKDISGVEWVSVFWKGKKLREFKFPPYIFSLDPADFPRGTVEIRVEAKDRLGNIGAESFALRFTGQREGEFCSHRESCQKPFICVKRTDFQFGRCRRPCRTGWDCPRGQLCKEIDGVKACILRSELYIRTEKKLRTSGELEPCSSKRPCGRGLLCTLLRDRRSVCLRLCGRGRRCGRGFFCRKLSGGKERVCVPVVRKSVRIRRVGERCSPELPCERGAVCLRIAGRMFSQCYKRCRDSSQCPRGLKCMSTVGSGERVCLYISERPSVPPYRPCSPAIPCALGYVCAGMSVGKTICHPSCRGGGCTGVCVRVGGESICLKPCDPLRPNCPPNTRCLFYIGEDIKRHLCQ